MDCWLRFCAEEFLISLFFIAQFIILSDNLDFLTYHKNIRETALVGTFFPFIIAIF